ncbi:SMODS domain-containing nucleotidyltransferase [Xanthomonas oryzae]|uniref:SMODS domain-containing nucleotidyltransferase n=1 Tax=Xanthomonas oryzae TaxID=347 RepID=UPI0006AC9C86|nr:nucleotidyltransferase [Xanthomonas oryzae]QBG92236.1 nucleotidyltransferase [Xanthomonas oryzae]QGH66212.1 nucleotidyltransferase [Xanthomonas oryzae pv. oryzicola]
MSVAEMFSGFLGNLAVDNSETISLRYGELTAALNKKFRDTESKTDNTLQVGSFGRKTGIKGISDLDMLYIMPKGKWTEYNKAGGQFKLLEHAREAIKERYPNTRVRVDRLVVTVTYKDFHIEVQPVFEQGDGSYKYPDTKSGGSWKITKPREEMAAVAILDDLKNCNLRRLCKMARAWKNKHGVGIGGLLIDTLAYNFLKSTNSYDTKSYLYYDWMSRDFFKYLSELEEQDEYAAPGSRQRVRVKKKFQKKANKGYQLCIDAIASEKTEKANEKWKKVYGKPFPAGQEKSVLAKDAKSWKDTEEFVEDRFSIDVREDMKIDCDVKQRGFRKHTLRDLIKRGLPLWSEKTLEFRLVRPVHLGPGYELFWKVLNRGSEAERRDCIRGQIVRDAGHLIKTESTTFQGEHIVEAYIVRDGVVVAKDRIHVPIRNGSRDYD